MLLPRAGSASFVCDSLVNIATHDYEAIPKVLMTICSPYL